MNTGLDAEGWYEDPYNIHQHRWFSAGSPTSLVRDSGDESRDAPPGTPPDEPLVRAVDESTSANGDDLRRADENRGGSYDSNGSWDAAIDANAGWGLYLT